MPHKCLSPSCRRIKRICIFFFSSHAPISRRRSQRIYNPFAFHSPCCSDTATQRTAFAQPLSPGQIGSTADATCCESSVTKSANVSSATPLGSAATAAEMLSVLAISLGGAAAQGRAHEALGVHLLRAGLLLRAVLLRSVPGGRVVRRVQVVDVVATRKGVALVRIRGRRSGRLALRDREAHSGCTGNQELGSGGIQGALGLARRTRHVNSYS